VTQFNTKGHIHVIYALKLLPAVCRMTFCTRLSCKNAFFQHHRRPITSFLSVVHPLARVSTIHLRNCILLQLTIWRTHALRISRARYSAGSSRDACIIVCAHIDTRTEKVCERSIRLFKRSSCNCPAWRTR